MTNKNEIKIFKALSEELRLRIVIMLTHGELCVCDIMEILKLPQSTISRHMAKLKSVGLVTNRRDGKWVHYSLQNLSDFPSSDLLNLLLKMRSKPPYTNDLSRLTEYLKNNKSC